MITKETKTLLNGNKVPVLGFGTWMIPNDKASEAVRNAIKVGYRHIDTAEAYGNEEGVGKGIRECGLPREEIFLTTKLIAEAKTYEEAKKAIEESLKKLNVDYIDLMLIHSPEPWNDFRNGNHYFKGNLEAWRALEEYYKLGKIKAIGVSNFEKEDLENIISNSSIKPMANQILTHISNAQVNLIKYCEDLGIVVEAYSPIAHGSILNNSVVVNMAKKYKVSPAQLCIRFTLDLGLVSLPKASSLEHIKENANVDFKITEEDMKTLLSMEHFDEYGEYRIFPVFQNKIKDR